MKTWSAEQAEAFFAPVKGERLPALAGGEHVLGTGEPEFVARRMSSPR